MMADHNKEKRLSIRLDNATAEKLKKVMAARDVSQSDAVRLCIRGAQILHIGNAKNLATEFCRIRMALDNNCLDEKIRKEVDLLCQYIRELLRQIEEAPKSESE